jgi:hypothetical protein
MLLTTSCRRDTSHSNSRHGQWYFSVIRAYKNRSSLFLQSCEFYTNVKDLCFFFLVATECLLLINSAFII